MSHIPVMTNYIFSEQSTEVQPLSELRGRAFIRSRAEALPS